MEGYNAFANEVMRYLSTKGILKETFDRYAAAYSGEIESIDELSSEVAANAAEALMKSEDFLKELFTDKDFIQHIEGTKAQSFVEKVIAKLKEILDSIKQFMADATLNHTVAEVFAEDTEQLNRMVKLWTDAFKGAAMSEVQSIAKENTDTESSGDVKYSQSEGEQYNYSNLISKPDMFVPEVKSILVPMKPDGTVDRKAVIKSSLANIRKANNPMNTDDKVFLYNKDLNRNIKITTESISHGLQRNYNKNIFASLSLSEYFPEAICVNELETRDGVENTYILLGSFENNGDIYYVRMVVEEKNNVFSAEDINVLYAVNTKKEPGAIARPGFGVKTANPTTGSTVSIADFLENVKDFHGDVLSQDVYSEFQGTRPKTNLQGLRYSLPETDSKGNELTEQQREYFKDSKVVDSEGRLMVVYHGSPSKFTVFSHSKINSHGNAHGRGFYFTENKSLAEGYEKGDGQLLEGYLDIKKPLSEDKVTIKKSILLQKIL